MSNVLRLPALRLCLLLFTAFITYGCENTTGDRPEVPDTTAGFEEEKAAILHALNSETKAAFDRDYDAWQGRWVHSPAAVKTYMNFADSTFSESVGWTGISRFVKAYLEAHPVPEPVPVPVADIEVRLYGDGAYVTFRQMDSLRGLKREMRIMEKTEGQWKIAGMHTTIYGLQGQE
jgi:hypothetical protein